MSDISVKGEWRKVTRADEVYVGQRIRYGSGDDGYGFDNNKYKYNKYRKVGSIKDSRVNVVDKDSRSIKSFDVLIINVGI